MDDNDNIISFTTRLKERKAAEMAAQEEWTERPYTPLPEPTEADALAFVKVLGYIRQLAPDATGTITFDDFAARISLDVNKIDREDDIPQVNVALAIEGVIPLIWSELTSEEVEDPETECSLDEIATVARSIILQLDSDENDLADMISEPEIDEDEDDEE